MLPTYVHIGLALDGDGVEELIGRGIAQLRIVFEHDELPHGHLAPGSAVVVLEHIQNGSPQKFQIILGHQVIFLRQNVLDKVSICQEQKGKVQKLMLICGYILNLEFFPLHSIY